MPRHQMTTQIKTIISNANEGLRKISNLRKLRKSKGDLDPDYRPTQAKYDRLVTSPSCEDDIGEPAQLFRRSTRVTRNLQKLDVQALDSSSDTTSQCDVDESLSEISDFVDLDDEMLNDLDLYQDIDCVSNKGEKDLNSAIVTYRGRGQENKQKQNSKPPQTILAETSHCRPIKVEKPEDSKADRNADIAATPEPICRRTTRDGNRFTEKRRKCTNVCPICNKRFQQLGHLRSHFLLHTGERPFVCEICDKSFSQSGHLISHINSHTSFRPYICDYCDKRFTQSGHKRNHERSHLGIRPYECNQCGKKFTQSGHLVNHLRIHVGDKPYSCEVCGRSFTQSGHLSSHMKTHFNYNNKY